MKVALINTDDFRRGCSRAALRLNEGLNRIGCHSKFLVKHKTSRDPSVLDTWGTSTPLTENVFYCTHVLQRQHVEQNMASDTYYAIPYPGYDVSGLDEVLRADLINLHWVTNFQSPVTLRRLFNLGKPVVWTFHDENAYTGGCHSTVGCKKYEAQCSECPQLDYDPCDLARQIFLDKAEAYEGAPLSIVCPSKWLADRTKGSALFAGRRVEVIPNGLDVELFSPMDKAEAKKRLGIPVDSVVLLFGADNAVQKIKGVTELVEALRGCLRETALRAPSIREKLVLLIFGSGNSLFNGLGLPLRSLGMVGSDKELRRAYSAGDVFLLPSLEDNLPNTMLESMACGTPLAAFATGGIPDVVVDGQNGALAPTGDTQGLGRCISSLILNEGLRKEFGQRGRRLIKEQYSLETTARRYEDLFSDLLSSGKGKISANRETAALKAPALKDNPVQNKPARTARLDDSLGTHFGAALHRLLFYEITRHLPAGSLAQQGDGDTPQNNERDLAETVRELYGPQHRLALASEVEKRYEQIINSLSWKITAPLRAVAELLKRAKAYVWGW